MWGGGAEISKTFTLAFTNRYTNILILQCQEVRDWWVRDWFLWILSLFCGDLCSEVINVGWWS